MLSYRLSILCFILAVISSIFVGIALLSGTTSDRVVETLSWSRGTFNSNSVNYDVYVGTYELVLRLGVNNDDNMETLKYTDPSCTASFCKNCKSSNRVSFAFAAVFFLSSIVSCITSYRRFSGSGNTSAMRWTGLICELIAIICGSLAMAIFASGCQKSVVEDNDTIDLTWSYGPSFGLIAAATVLKSLETLVSFCILADSHSNLTLDGSSPTTGREPAIVMKDAPPMVSSPKV